MTDLADTLLLARAERERRKRARLRAFPSYGEWLPQASPSFCWDWAWQRYVQGVYDRVTSGELTKVMIFAPPRHGKSELGTIRYPVYRLERERDFRTIVAAYGQTLAEKFSRKARKIAVSRGIGISRDKNTAAEWETEQGGGVRAVGVGGSITGMGAKLVLIDDPVKGRKEANSEVVQSATFDWFTDDLYTRLEPDGSILLQMTRWSMIDLAARILESEDGKNWHVVRLPALAEEDDPLGRAIGEALCPERFDRDKLLELERILRTSFYALFQGRPTAKEGGIFKRDWLKVEARPTPVRVLTRVRHWDFAATEGDGDWTAGVLMSKDANGRFWVEDVVRGQWAPTKRDETIRKTAEKDPPGTRFSGEQEPGSAGVTAAQAFVRLLSGFPAVTVSSSENKELRAEPFASQAGADNVRLLPGRWNAAYVNELVEFNNGKHDDQVDGSSGAFNQIAGKRQGKSY